MADAKLLSPPTNFAIVHLPGRAFPGVVFQGDNLHALIRELRQAMSEADRDEQTSILKGVVEMLLEVQSSYERVLDRDGIEIPYTRGTES